MENMFNQIRKPTDANYIDDLTDALVNNLKYADNDVQYPNIDAAEPDDGVIAEWFYPVYNGTNDFSELTSILMYTSQETRFDEIGELMLGIALTEMKHYAKIGDLIVALGGKLTQRYENTSVTIGKSVREALSTALQSEQNTIKFYNELSDKIQTIKSTKTTQIALQLIAKLVADEELHVNLLKQGLELFSKREERTLNKLEDLIDE
jgi:bacterioferritin (cytochrome b1)